MAYQQITEPLIGKDIFMSYKVISDVNMASQVKVQGKNTGLTITSGSGQVYPTDVNGAITFPLLTTDDVDYITLELPLSQYGELYDNTSLNVTSTGFNLNFNREVPLFMSGIYFKVPTQTIALAPPASGTYIYHVYVVLDLGVPMYKVSRAESLENNISMFIGNVTVSTTGITNIDVNRVSRFGTYRPNINQQGSAFPVSTGHPAQTGTINW